MSEKSIQGQREDESSKGKISPPFKVSGQDYYSLFNSAVDAITILDATGILDCNEAALRIYGYPSKSDFIGIHPGCLAPARQPDGSESMAAANAQIALAYKNGVCFFEWLHKKKDGTTFLSEVSLCKVEICGRSVLQGVVRDITLRKEAEQALKQSELNYRSIFEVANDAIAIHDIDTFDIVEVNRKHTQMFGYTQKQIRSYGRVDILSSGVAPYTEEEAVNWLKKAAGGTPQIFEWKAKNRQHRHFSVEVSLKRVVIQGKYRILAMMRDITERKKAEEELLRSREQLRHLTSHLEFVREEERKKIAREIHDDLGQALTVLKMDVAWIQKQLTGTEKSVQEKMSTMSRFIDETIEAVQKIYGDLRPGLLDHLGLVAAMEWHVEEFQKRTGLDCRLSVDDSENLSVDINTSTTLFRIFQEALTNVYRHAAAGRMWVRLKKDAGVLTLTVRDDGCGIRQDRILSPTSFGLIGIKERVSYLGGHFHIQGHPGAGSTITVSVPVNACAAIGTPAADSRKT